MALSVHDFGDTVILRADFVDLEEQPAVPEDFSGTIRAPDGTVSDLAAFEQDAEDVNVWTTSHTVEQSGRWFWRIEYTGADLPQVEEHGFLVRDRLVSEEGS